MTAPPTDARHCALRLRAAVSALTRRLRSALPETSISVAKLSVLARLHQEPLTPTELASRERVRLQSLSRLIAELEADGWLKREADPADGRRSSLSLTPLGVRQLTADVHRREASLLVAIDAALSPDEQALLLQACALLDRIGDALADAPMPAKAGRLVSR